MSRPSLKKGLGIMALQQVTNTCANKANAGIEVAQAELLNAIEKLENYYDINVVSQELENARRSLNDATGYIWDAVELAERFAPEVDGPAYYFAVHCDEHANPAEAVEVVIFSDKEHRDDFINSTSWPYEAVNDPTEIYAGPFWDWAEVKADLAELGNPSHVIWSYEPKKTEPDMMVITTAI